MYLGSNNNEGLLNLEEVSYEDNIFNNTESNEDANQILKLMLLQIFVKGLNINIIESCNDEKILEIISESNLSNPESKFHLMMKDILEGILDKNNSLNNEINTNKLASDLEKIVKGLVLLSAISFLSSSSNNLKTGKQDLINKLSGNLTLETLNNEILNGIKVLNSSVLNKQIKNKLSDLIDHFDDIITKNTNSTGLGIPFVNLNALNTFLHTNDNYMLITTNQKLKSNNERNQVTYHRSYNNSNEGIGRYSPIYN